MSSDAEDINACGFAPTDSRASLASTWSWRDLRATLENHIGYPSKAQTSRVLNRQLLKVRVCCREERAVTVI